MATEETHSLLRSDRLSRDFVSVGVADTVAQALEKIRASADTREIFYCYACDPEGRLVGVVPIRKLIRAAPDERIASLMFDRVVKLPEDAPDSLVEDFFVTYRFLAFPVVDKAGRIAGVVELDSFVDTYSQVLDSEVEGRIRDEVFRLLGMPRDELKETRPVRIALRRFPWLLVNIAGGFLAATTSRLFEGTLTRYVIVAAFIPMVLVLSESLGVQTVAVSATMIAEGHVDLPTVRREIRAVSLAGMMAATVVALLARLSGGGWTFPLGLWLAVTLATTFAAALGAALPFLFRSFKVDPHLASAPLVLAISDNVTLLVYLGLAWELLP